MESRWREQISREEKSEANDYKKQANLPLEMLMKWRCWVLWKMKVRALAKMKGFLDSFNHWWAATGLYQLARVNSAVTSYRA